MVAQTTYTNLPSAAAPLNGTEVVAVVQAGASVQTNVAAIAAYAQSPQAYTVAGLPPATGNARLKAYVTDANSTTFASVVAGGGSNYVPVYCDGSHWRIG